MKKLVLSLGALTLLLTFNLSLAQEPPKMPKPGPEHKRLNYFAGKWTFAEEMKQSPFGPAGKVTGTDQNEILSGGFFLVMHSEGKGPMGELKELEVIGYDAEEKVYIYHGFNNFGEAETYRGTVQGDTWTWTSESRLVGK